jgi:hypothetical protein
MLKSPPEKPNTTEKTLQASPQDASPHYIFSEETVQSLQALGAILRRIDNRLEAEKAAAIGVEPPNYASMKK